MNTDQIVSLVVGIVLVVVVGYFTVWPPLRERLLSRIGIEGTAVIRQIGYSSAKNENKRYLHAMRLEVQLPGEEPYEVRLTQLLPWMSGPGTPGREVVVRVHPRFRNSVVVVGPVIPADVAAALPPELAGRVPPEVAAEFARRASASSDAKSS